MLYDGVAWCIVLCCVVVLHVMRWHGVVFGMTCVLGWDVAMCVGMWYRVVLGMRV